MELLALRVNGLTRFAPVSTNECRTRHEERGGQGDGEGAKGKVRLAKEYFLKDEFPDRHAGMICSLDRGINESRG